MSKRILSIVGSLALSLAFAAWFTEYQSAQQAEASLEKMAPARVHILPELLNNSAWDYTGPRGKMVLRFEPGGRLTTTSGGKDSAGRWQIADQMLMVHLPGSKDVHSAIFLKSMDQLSGVVSGKSKSSKWSAMRTSPSPTKEVVALAMERSSQGGGGKAGLAIIAVAAASVAFVGYKIYQRVKAVRLRKQLSALMVQLEEGRDRPLPLDSEYGPLALKGGAVHFTLPLPCPPYGVLPVEIEADSNRTTISDGTRLAVSQLKAHWPGYWAVAEPVLETMVKDYGNEESWTEGEVKLSLALLDHYDVDSQVSIGLEFEPFAGYYDVEIKGSEIIDRGAAF